MPIQITKDGSIENNVTNAGTFTVQENGAALTALQLIDDTVYTDGSGTPSKGILILGKDATNPGAEKPRAIIIDATGHLQIDVVGSLPTGTNSIGQVTANAGTNLNTSALALEAGNLATIAGKDFATQTTLAAINAKMVTGTDIGDVTINNTNGASAVNIQDGGNSITVDQSTGTNLHTVVDSGTITTITNAVTVNSHAVTNAGTFAVQSTSVLPGTLVSGRKTVATAGTAEVLKADTALSQGILIQALKTNTNNVFVGDSNVDKTADKQYELEPGESTSIAVNNTNLIYVDVTTNGEGVQFIGS